MRTYEPTIFCSVSAISHFLRYLCHYETNFDNHIFALLHHA